MGCINASAVTVVKIFTVSTRNYIQINNNKKSFSKQDQSDLIPFNDHNDFSVHTARQTKLS